ncbi:ubiquitin-binding protein cue5 [Xylographa parallela]|nr:ubiquitin-binding protein cue5 [Xylographa parallela]
MADPEKPKIDGPPESPTTARELDFDDEDLTASPRPAKPTTGSHSLPPYNAQEDVAPPQPPRPLSPRQQSENTLKEAFPSIDAAVVKAVLTASGGQLEPAFHALLGMSDPDSQYELAPPPQPPRPVSSAKPRTGQSQLEADEQYARQLAEHYNGTETYGGPPRSSSRDQRARHGARSNRDTSLKPNEIYDDDREHSFIDDDLPVIRDNIRKGFIETQSKVNSFINSLKKRIDGEDEEGSFRPPARTATGYSSGQIQQYGGRRSGDVGRRSGDRDRYDADPQVLGDDFATLHLHDETTPPRRSTRPLANPDLFKPTPASPPRGRGVSFQDGPPEEIDELYRVSPDPTKRPTSSASRGKWQPLAAVDPHPIADHDPFSLGDSDEEDAKKKDLKADDSKRLENVAAEAIADDTAAANKDLQPQETLGSAGIEDKEVVEKLTKS